MHIILIGTKAQLVKVAPIIYELERAGVPYYFVLTGQHVETIDDLLQAFGLREPDDVLVARGESDTPMKLLSWLALAWRAAQKKEYFRTADSILVHGDTLSTLLGALIGRRFGRPVVHVEAGLRSFNLMHPFPEELVRVIVSRLAHIHFCSGSWAAGNLANKNPQSVVNTELNSIVDALRFALTRRDSQPSQENYAVVSLHRYENISSNSRFEFLMNQILKISGVINLKFILHPVTRLKLAESGWDKKLIEAGVQLQERMDYVSFMQLLAASRFLISDGGSNQEEAAYMGLPCLIMRKATERQEGIGENAVLSMYDDAIISRFIKEHAGATWQLQTLPDIYPSRQIALYLKRFTGDS